MIKPNEQKCESQDEIDRLLDSLNRYREKMRDFHDILYTLAMQNGGELRFKPPVERQKMVNIFFDARTAEVVISSNTEIVNP